MQQMNVPEEMKINFDFTKPGLPESIKAFRPLVFHDGNAYCCVLGPDPQLGIFGCGDTAELALQDWDQHFQERKKSKDDRDEVAKFIQDMISTPRNNVW